VQRSRAPTDRLKGVMHEPAPSHSSRKCIDGLADTAPQLRRGDETSPAGRPQTLTKLKIAPWSAGYCPMEIDGGETIRRTAETVGMIRMMTSFQLWAGERTT
jgi:hypothetical protein